MRIYLDDLRPTPPGWVHAYWPDEVIAMLRENEVEEISLDHDLGDDARGTGYDVLKWIEEQVVFHGFKPPRIQVHSANPVAKVRMLAAIESIERMSARNPGTNKTGEADQKPQPIRKSGL